MNAVIFTPTLKGDLKTTLLHKTKLPLGRGVKLAPAFRLVTKKKNNNRPAAKSSGVKNEI